ncbi:MAG: glycosyltransferase family 2 protein [Burkholderiaceae bacterium]
MDSLLRTRCDVRDAPPPPGAAAQFAGAAIAAETEPAAASRTADPTLTCILPCHNEAENLNILLPRLSAVLSALVARFEIVIVDDGSSDDTARVIDRWARRGGVRGIELSRNFGKEAAMTAGLQAANGDVVIIMDADLQHEPEIIPALYSRWREGFDVAYALRSSRSGESALKRAGARLFYRLVATRRFDVPPDAGDFRLMDRDVVDALLALPERNRFMKGLYAWIGFRSIAVPYLPAARRHGSSHYGVLPLIRLSLDGLTSFTTWPLRAVSLSGIVIALLAFSYGAYLTIDFLLYGNDVSGWTTIVVAMMLIAGIQLFSLGVVGEYVGRIFEEAKGRPLFVVRRHSGSGLTGPRE